MSYPKTKMFDGERYQSRGWCRLESDARHSFHQYHDKGFRCRVVPTTGNGSNVKGFAIYTRKSTADKRW